MGWPGRKNPTFTVQPFKLCCGSVLPALPHREPTQLGGGGSCPARSPEALLSPQDAESPGSCPARAQLLLLLQHIPNPMGMGSPASRGSEHPAPASLIFIHTLTSPGHGTFLPSPGCPGLALQGRCTEGSPGMGQHEGWPVSARPQLGSPPTLLLPK